MNKIPLHPLLFAVAPVLFLFDKNSSSFPLTVLPLPIICSALFALSLYALAYVAFRNFHRAAILVSTLILFIFSHKHVTNSLESMASRLASHVDLVFLLFVGSYALLIVLLAAVTFILVKGKGLLPVNRFLTLFSIVWCVISTFNILASKAKSELRAQQQRQISSNSPGVSSQSSTNSQTPDIYYIIPDCYGRSDVLKNIFHYDNNHLIQFLSRNGFYVAPESRSNYQRTLLSLSSSLNLDYLHNCLGKNYTNEMDWVYLRNLMHNNQVMHLLQSHGYKTVCFSTGYHFSELTKADFYMKPKVGLDEFNSSLLDTTVLSGMLKPLLGYSLFDVHRERVLFTLEELPQVAARKTAGRSIQRSITVCTTEEHSWRRMAPARRNTNRDFATKRNSFPNAFNRQSRASSKTLPNLQ